MTYVIFFLLATIAGSVALLVAFGPLAVGEWIASDRRRIEAERDAAQHAAAAWERQADTFAAENRQLRTSYSEAQP